MPEIIRKSEVVAMAPARWARQYDNGRYGPDKARITSALAALAPGFTAEQVEVIIGNKSWSTITCDECRREADVLVQFGSWKDEGGADVCEACISAALEQVRSCQP